MDAASDLVQPTVLWRRISRGGCQCSFDGLPLEIEPQWRPVPPTAAIHLRGIVHRNPECLETNGHVIERHLRDHFGPKPAAA